MLSVLTATACGGLPWPRSRRELAADIRELGFTFGSFAMLTSTAIASSACVRASAAISSSRFGRPEGLPDCPGANRPVSALIAGGLSLSSSSRRSKGHVQQSCYLALACSTFIGLENPRAFPPQDARIDLRPEAGPKDRVPSRVQKMARSLVMASMQLPGKRRNCVTISPHVPRWVLGASGAMPNNSIRRQPSAIALSKRGEATYFRVSLSRRVPSASNFSAAGRERK